MDLHSRDLQKAAGVTRLQIVRWTEAGVLIPKEDAIGRGRRRVFSKRNLQEAILGGALSRRGIGIGTIREIMEFLRQTPEWLVKEDIRLKERYGRDDYLSFYSRDLYSSMTDAPDKEIEGTARLLDTMRAYCEGRIRSWWDLVQFQKEGIVAIFEQDGRSSFTLTYPGFLNELFEGTQYPKSEVLILIDVSRILDMAEQ